MPDKRKERILIVSDAWHPQINGVVRTYEHLQAELQDLGHEVSVVGPRDFPVRLPLPGYREIDIALFPYRRLARIIKNFNPDYIHLATEGPLGWTGQRYCRRHKRRFTTAYHTQFPAYLGKRVGKILPFLENWVQKTADRFLRRFHARSNGIIVTTPTLEEELKTRQYSAPLFPMARGVPVTMFKPGPQTLFEYMERPVALYVGRVAIEKNLDAFLGMTWEGSKVVVGGGPSLKDYRKKYPDIFFTGPKTGYDLAEHYRSADIFVFPSLTDTFGIVILEALASGLPVAAYNVTGPRDIITSPELGALASDGTLASAAVRALVSDGTPRQRYDHICRHYTWSAVAGEFLRILRTCERDSMEI